MKKVAIFTLCGYKNFGNRLQNYALQETIKKMKYDVETIWLYNEKKYSLKNTIIKQMKNIVRIILKGNNQLKTEKEKTDKFKEFNKNIKINYNFKDVIDGKDKYDYYVVGSDQVWNYTFKDVNEIYFLPFVEKQKAVSYAASFGVSEIPDEYISKYKDGLNHFSNISVREETASNIVSKITKNKPTIVLDPTLLLTKEDWNKITKKPLKTPTKKYILKCFLGDDQISLNSEIDKLAKENNLEIIDLYDINKKDTYVVGPQEFLYYVNNAEMILTDSYHTTIFSILFERPFLVFERKQEGQSMISRIDYLLSKLGLSNRKVDKIEDSNNVFEFNYKETLKVIEEEKKNSMEFLYKSLK